MPPGATHQDFHWDSEVLSFFRKFNFPWSKNFRHNLTRYFAKFSFFISLLGWFLDQIQVRNLPMDVLSPSAGLRSPMWDPGGRESPERVTRSTTQSILSVQSTLSTVEDATIFSVRHNNRWAFSRIPPLQILLTDGCISYEIEERHDAKQKKSNQERNSWIWCCYDCSCVDWVLAYRRMTCRIFHTWSFFLSSDN